MAMSRRAPIASAGIVEIPMAQPVVRPASSASPSPASRLLSRSPFLGRRFLQPDDADADEHGIASRRENGVLTASVKKRRPPPPPPEKKKTKLRSLFGNYTVSRYMNKKSPARKKFPN